MFLVLVLTASPVLAQDPTPEPNIYVVQSGDTLSAIAQRFGVTVDVLVAANDITNPALIVVGQKLTVPAPGPAPQPATPAPQPPPRQRIHSAQPGETLPFLAFRYGTTVWALRAENDLNLFAALSPGQELVVPSPLGPDVQAPTFPAISFSPAPVSQGQTLLVEVRGEGDLALDGRLPGLADEPLLFSGAGKGYWALTGVHTLADPGIYTLILTATETASGDLLTMREPVTITAGHFDTLYLTIPASRQNLLDPALSRAEAQKVNQVFAGVSDRRLWGSPFKNPLQGELRLTAQFGQRRSYGGGPPSSYHAGQDLGADEGTPVYAPAQGVVALAEPLQVRGNAVIIDHGLGVFTGFWHLSRIDVAVGQVVIRGQQLGLVGDTGLSTGPHLHWEMRVRGVAVDPLQWTQQALP